MDLMTFVWTLIAAVIITGLIILFVQTRIPQLDLFLLGKTGQGKSSTGNSILGYTQFKSASCSTSVTSAIGCSSVTRVARGWSLYNLKVIDWPGLEDTNLSRLEGLERACHNMDRALTRCSAEGIHAFLMVMKFGSRFTAEDRGTLYSLRHMLGPNFLRDFGVIVITHGDDFQDSMKEEGHSADFMSWCRRQTGELATLFRECDYRCVLFNNRRKAKTKEKKQQLEMLVKVVEQMRQKNGCARYTINSFLRYQGLRDKLILECKAPQLKEKYRQQISQLSVQVLMVRSLDKMAATEERVDNLIWTITTEDKGTGVLQELKAEVQEMRHRLSQTKQTLIRKKQLEDERKRRARQECQVL